jgi:hypothetical protein
MTPDSVHSGTNGDDHARFHQSCTCGYQRGPFGSGGTLGFVCGFDTARVVVLFRRAG